MKRNVRELESQVFDVLVLGGGITGAGVALDASLRGLAVALIDKGDFASGTSSASSKLIHGGLRYLEHGDFRLVYEALHERSLLLQNAPHAVHPLRFVIPVRRHSRMPAWKWRAGLALYDLLAGKGNIRRSRPLARSSLLGEFTQLRPTDLECGAEYYDAQMDDARLCIDVLQSAASAGACLANYVEAIQLNCSRNGASVALAKDRLDDRPVAIRARVILNAAGPWVDNVCQRAGDATAARLSPTKGVHVLAPNRGLEAGFLLLHPADGRVFFVLPWLGKTLIGTTDTFDKGDPDDLAISDEDIRYLLCGFNDYFDPPIEADQLLGRFVGLRPLLRGNPDSPSAISREFRIFTSESGLVSVAGGKYTTFRRMAEEIVDFVTARLGKKRRCLTRSHRLAGVPKEPWRKFARSEASLLAARHGLSKAAAEHLIQRYGTRAAKVLDNADGRPELLQPVAPGEPDLRAEVLYQRDYEMAVRIEDCLLRRTRLGLFCPALLRSPPKGLQDLFGREAETISATVEKAARKT